MPRLNVENKTIDLMPHDFEFIMASLLREYYFFSKGERPSAIIFPMYQSAPHPDGGDPVTIMYVPPDSPIVAEIEEDVSLIPKVTPDQLSKIESEDDEVQQLRKEIAELGEQLAANHAELESTPVPEAVAEYLDEATKHARTAPDPNPDPLSVQLEPVASAILEVPIGTEVTTSEGAKFRLTETGWQEVEAYVSDKPAPAKAPTKGKKVSKSLVTKDEAQDLALSASQDTPPRVPRQIDNPIPPGQALDERPRRVDSDTARIARDLRDDAPLPTDEDGRVLSGPGDGSQVTGRDPDTGKPVVEGGSNEPV